MDDLFRFRRAVRHQPAIDEWLSSEPHQLFALARQWFTRLRSCGDDVTELMQDGCPTACVDDAAFAYVNVYRTHVNVGFFRGAFLPDPDAVLEGTGKRMRHVKLRPGETTNTRALELLINAAYRDMRHQLGKS